jgi:hypothetical protein
MSIIPGVETFHPREVWEPNGIDAWYGKYLLGAYGDLRRASAFHRQPRTLDITGVTHIATHYTAAINLPDGDPNEIQSGVDGIRSLLAATHYSYLASRTDGGYRRLSDDRLFPGYPLGYSFAIDWLGGVWEINGWDYQPAATNQWNEEALAWLMLTDRADAGSELMWRSHRALSREALRRGAKIAPERVWSHGWFAERTGTGTPTGCCGDALEDQINAGLGDWTRHDQPTEPPEGDEMINAATLRFKDATGFFDDQVVALTIANPHQHANLAPTRPPVTVTIDAAGKAEIEAQLGFKLTRSK